MTAKLRAAVCTAVQDVLQAGQQALVEGVEEFGPELDVDRMDPRTANSLKSVVNALTPAF